MLALMTIALRGSSGLWRLRTSSSVLVLVTLLIPPLIRYEAAGADSRGNLAISPPQYVVV